MKILIDMNLSPGLVAEFSARGIESVHWSAVGDPKAEDSEIMDFALRGGYLVFTHDLDFGAILAATRATGPSVIQIRTQDVLSNRLADIVSIVVREHETALVEGALITVDEARARVRILPLRKP